jgi:hypothetical protein
MQTIIRTERVIDTTLTMGGAPVTPRNLEAVAAVNRPRDWFSYVLRAIAYLTFTPTYTGQGSNALARCSQLDLIEKIWLELRHLTRPLVQDHRGYDIAASAQQMLEDIDPDLYPDFAGSASGIGVNGTGQEVTIALDIPFAVLLNKVRGIGRFVGAIPLSLFDGAKLQFYPKSTSDLGGNWAVPEVAFAVDLVIADSNVLLPFVPVHYDLQQHTGSGHEIPRGEADSRMFSLLASTDDRTDLTLPTAYSFSSGRQVISANNSPTDQIARFDRSRRSGVNDAGWLRALPIVGMGQSSDPTDQPIFTGAASVTNAFSGEANVGQLSTVASEELTEAQHVKIFRSMGLSESMAVSAAERHVSSRTAENYGTIDQVLAVVP